MLGTILFTSFSCMFDLLLILLEKMCECMLRTFVGEVENQKTAEGVREHFGAKGPFNVDKIREENPWACD